jgi:hypothetical protein
VVKKPEPIAVGLNDYDELGGHLVDLVAGIHYCRESAWPRPELGAPKPPFGPPKTPPFRFNAFDLGSDRRMDARAMISVASLVLRDGWNAPVMVSYPASRRRFMLARRSNGWAVGVALGSESFYTDDLGALLRLRKKLNEFSLGCLQRLAQLVRHFALRSLNLYFVPFDSKIPTKGINLTL